MTEWDSPEVRDRLWVHISTARWFSGKGRDGTLARLLPLAPVVDEDNLSVVPVIALVCYPQFPQEYYQLLLALRPATPGGLAQIHRHGQPVTVTDATTDEEALTAWARTILERDPQAADGSWQLHRLGNTPGPVPTATRFAGEQSNTSIIVGTTIIKMFRRLEAGDNLDITIHRSLNDAHVSSVAKLYGYISAHIPGEQDGHTDLAMVIERFPQPQDGWELITSQAADLADVTHLVADLGRCLKTIHCALEQTFATAELDGTQIADAMVRRLDAATAAAPALQPYRNLIISRYDKLRGRHLAAQQVHGDFHLGQTLLTPDGWRVIDFEGEPLKPLTERRLPDSRWRDVAGMMRSLSYATSAHPQPTAPETLAWARRAREAFLDGYGQPNNAERDVLAAYEADKAGYEVVYETLNRPTWVDIPLTAIRVMGQN
ncbi:phosphotransferase [Cutibacterium sp.]|uniref:maltokinase N-terminal cap-like domain-containing protein n=1 Tax=Cutibacterium sp. TaxID=1912221 RepID=UPI0026DBC8FA|nr:phosphotransferase [Cutibacterium sp.]MDO4411926.1 phosphotransferase [Cutibacterium sp.]